MAPWRRAHKCAAAAAALWGWEGGGYLLIGIKKVNPHQGLKRATSMSVRPLGQSERGRSLREEKL